jgi:hypothetical protein
MTSFKSFVDEVEKIAFDRKKMKRTAKVIGGALGGAALAAGGLVALRPGLRAQAKHVLTNIGKSRYAKEEAASLPPAAVANAKAIAEQLRAAGINPATSRIAISGTGGTGKSTLARALGQEMKMGVRSLDGPIGGGSDLAGTRLSRFLSKNPIPEGTIADQTHLLTHVDPDKFDVIVRVSKPTKEVEKQILSRGRGAGQIEMYDYGKLDKAISTAFNSTDGKVVAPAKGVEFKIKPPGGFRSNEILREQATKAGFHLPSSADRSKVVNAVGLGEAQSGIIPYIKKGRIAGGAAILTGTGAAGAYGVHRASNRR